MKDTPLLIESETPRGFQTIECLPWVAADSEKLLLPLGKPIRVLQCSSVVNHSEPEKRSEGGYFLWIGDPGEERPHLSIPQVRELIKKLQNWVDHGTLHTEG